MSQADKVQDLLGVSDERVGAAAIAFPFGGVRSLMTAAGGWMALPLPKRTVVALTGRRLLVCSLGGIVVARPRKILYEFARSDMVDLEPPDHESGVAMALRLGVVLAGGSVLRFEFGRMAVEPDGCGGGHADFRRARR